MPSAMYLLPQCRCRRENLLKKTSLQNPHAGQSDDWLAWWNNCLELRKRNLNLIFSAASRCGEWKWFSGKRVWSHDFSPPGQCGRPRKPLGLVEIWGKISERVPLVFPVHPRTYKNIQRFDLQKAIDAFPHLYFIEPLGYLRFIHLVSRSMFTLTDSGGIQEETTYLGIPVLLFVQPPNDLLPSGKDQTH